MEEDIRILEELIDYCKEHLPPYYKDRDLKAIENLIKGYRELNDQICFLTGYDWKDIQNYFIPKSKIEDKIEELKKNEDCKYCNNACPKYARCMMLQELMEG